MEDLGVIHLCYGQFCPNVGNSNNPVGRDVHVKHLIKRASVANRLLAD